MSRPVPVALKEVKYALFQNFHSLNHLKHVHGRLFRTGLSENHYVLNMLLKNSFKFKSPQYSNLIFSHTLDPNVFIWNTMIRGLVCNDCFNQVAIFSRLMMIEAGLLPDNFTLPFMFKACTRLLDFSFGTMLHTLVVKTGFDFDVYVKTGMVCFYAKCGKLVDAEKVFDDIPEKNVVSWTAIISGYIDLGLYREAIDMFRRSLEMGCRPDSFNLVRVLFACTHLGDLSTAEWFHGYLIENGMNLNVFVSTSLLDMYAKFGKMEVARNIFDEMPEKDDVSWGTMIQGYASNGHPKEALDIFYRMLRENLKPDCYSMVGVLSACARSGGLEVGESVCRMMERNAFLSNPVLGTALIDMYAKCGKISSAMDVFREMKEKDLVVWNAMISGLSIGGQVRSAFSCFGQLQKCGVRPDENTFLSLLTGCTHAGWVDDGRHCFHTMKHIYHLDPAIEHYGCMVDLLARAGLLDEAHSLIESMPIKPNAIVWGGLLSGCRLHRNTHMAEIVVKKLIELEPKNSGNYVLLSNMYSANHKYSDSEEIRSAMSGENLTKVAAYSWIEVEGTVHEFLVGDTLHPLLQNIYIKLSELHKEVKAAGYVPNTEYTFFDIEEEEKERVMSYHSEKLALAFGLIKSGPDDVIRITKNLRVCGDCHLFFKLVSKLTGREIVVRDTNRFHSFVDGSCSCHDYW